jgi:phage shock protein C
MSSKNASPSNKIVRSESDRMIAGVCGGIAAYFDIDASIVRLIFIAVILLGGSGILAYLILWFILPNEHETNQQTEEIMKQNVTEIKEATETASKEVKEIAKKSGKSIWGAVLIGLGVVFLLQNFGFAHYLQLDKTWPVLLIVLGFLIVGRS